MLIIRDNVGGFYPGIRDIYYEEFKDVFNNFGEIITITHNESNDDFFDTIGVTIHKSKHTPGKAYRIYNDVADYKYTNYGDLTMIEKLMQKQPKVKLTKFPTGVVRIAGHVVGQEVPYFENTVTISNFLEEKINKKVPTHYYIEILKIMKELLSVGIEYRDLHGGNFVVNKDTEEINLIDFEPFAIKFIDDIENYNYEEIITRLKFMLIKLNKFCDINFDDSFNEVKTMQDLEEYINNEHKKLLQK